MSAIDDLRAKHQTCIQYKDKLKALPFICRLNEILNFHTTPKQACLFLTHKTQDTPCPHLPLQLFSWLCCVSFLGNLQVIRRSSKFQTIRLEKWRKRKQHIHCEKPLGNVMFVFNPFFQPLLPLFDEHWVGAGGGFPVASSWLSLAASSEAFHSCSLCTPRHSFGLARPAPFHIAFLLCAVCFYFVLVFLFFLSHCFIAAKWSETSHQLPTSPPPPSQSRHSPSSNLWKQLLLLSNEWNAIKLMSMHVYSVELTGRLTEGLGDWMTD